MYCGWFEGFHIAIHCIVLQEKNQCIAMGIVSQDGCRRPKCVAIQNSIVTRGAGRALGRRRGRWARARAGRAGAGWRQAQACRQARGRQSARHAGRAAAGARGAAEGTWGTQQARGHGMDVRGRAAGTGRGVISAQKVLY